MKELREKCFDYLTGIFDNVSDKIEKDGILSVEQKEWYLRGIKLLQESMELDLKTEDNFKKIQGEMKVYPRRDTDLMYLVELFSAEGMRRLSYGTEMKELPEVGMINYASMSLDFSRKIS